jgi:hypothetical protein
MLKWSYSMDKSHVKDLFQLQTELIQTKVDMAVHNSIDRVLDGIADLKGDINHLEKRFTSLEHRVTSTKATLLSQNSVLKEIRTKFIEYSFRLGWGVFAVIASLLLYQFHSLFK